MMRGAVEFPVVLREFSSARNLLFELETSSFCFSPFCCCDILLLHEIFLLLLNYSFGLSPQQNDFKSVYHVPQPIGLHV